MKVEINRVNDAVHLEGQGTAPVKIQIDGSPDIGGQQLGARPMELVLMALGSCGSLDLITILKKQKQVIESFKVIVEGQRREQIPTVFTEIHMQFLLQGTIDPAKAERAAELAIRKYCSVHDMLVAGGVKVTYEISIA